MASLFSRVFNKLVWVDFSGSHHWNNLGMVNKHRVKKAISLSNYPLIAEFLGELAGTFALVVYKQNLDDHLWAIRSDSLIFFYRHDIFKLCIIGTKAQAVLTDGKLAEFLANRMGDGFGKTIHHIFEYWMHSLISFKLLIEFRIQVLWPAAGLQVESRVRYIQNF